MQATETYPCIKHTHMHTSGVFFVHCACVFFFIFHLVVRSTAIFIFKTYSHHVQRLKVIIVVVKRTGFAITKAYIYIKPYTNIHITCIDTRLTLIVLHAFVPNDRETKTTIVLEAKHSKKTNTKLDKKMKHERRTNNVIVVGVYFVYAIATFFIHELFHMFLSFVVIAAIIRYIFTRLIF